MRRGVRRRFWMRCWTRCFPPCWPGGRWWHGWLTTPGFLKKGQHSVGVTRQYCGQVGKQENCRVAVSLSMTTESSSMPVAYRLYLERLAELEHAAEAIKGS